MPNGTHDTRPRTACSRNRPPPQLRSRSSTIVAVLDSKEAKRRLDSYTTKLGARLSQRPGYEAAPVGNAFHQEYLLLIRHKLAETGAHGPLDIFERRHSGLFAKWLVAWRTGCAAAKLAGLRSALPKQGQRKLLAKRLQDYLKYRNLPHKPFFAQSPDDSCRSPLRQILVAAINRHHSWSSVEKQWLRSL